VSNFPMENKPFHEKKGFKWPSQPSCLWERRGLGILNQGPLGGKRTWKSQPSCFNEQLPLGEKRTFLKKRRIGILPSCLGTMFWPQVFWWIQWKHGSQGNFDRFSQRQWSQLLGRSFFVYFTKHLKLKNTF
jgi:hypothetical protein